jgi:hypothetical protein
MPDDAMARTNFAYALLLTRRIEEAGTVALQAGCEVKWRPSKMVSCGFGFC